ncbi:hypothetical protein [Romboutsia lituseburensis]|uniref:hypothetical protein n=1 Tax=Romboutsia lituseburensis TaxID=1537 RepID=UPI00215B5A11|nr:hypothetical protein [Romboutsia lituseburensis]MCR8743903.1 hypothetical protein [Romboutsia lituseburensis]
MENINKCNITIINYSNIAKLRDNKELFSKIKDADLHICASLITSIAMNFEYGKELESKIVINSGNFIGDIAGSWDQRETKLIQRLKLHNEIKLLEEEALVNKDEEYKELISTIKGNREDMLSSLRLLVECNIYPEDIEKNIDNITDEIKVFLDIWKRLELVDEEILKFRKKIYDELEDEKKLESELIKAANKSKTKQIKGLKKYFIEKSNLDYFIHKKSELENEIYNQIDTNIKAKEDEITKLAESIKHIEEVVNDKYEVKKVEKKFKKIVLQGFYFITPIQESIINLIIEKLNDVEIIFLNNYDKNNKEIFDIWDKTFANKYYPIKSNKYIGSKKTSFKWSDVFAEIYNGNSENLDETIKYIDSNIQRPIIKEYTNMITFQDDNDFENIDENTNNVYYSPDSEQLNSILDDVYPRKTKKHILSRPIGQLIRILHKIWNDSESIDLNIDVDILESCFVTGWLTIVHNGKEHNATSQVHNLRKIKNYFNDCKTLSQWEERYKLWKEGKEFIENNIGIKHILWNFSFFDVKDEDMILINLFVKQINNLVKLLNNDEESKYQKEALISSHFENIQSLIDKVLEITKKEIEDEEDQKVIDSLVKVLKEGPNNITCLSDDVIDALSEYLNTENTEYEGLDEKILNIKDIDASSILNKYKTVNLCQITSDFIPGIKNRYTWPLSKSFIQNLIDTIGNDDELLELRINRLKLIIEENTSRNKYLLFNALEASNNISVSLIKNINNEEYRECVYMTLLKSKANLEVENDNDTEFGFSKNKVELVDDYYSYSENKDYFNEKVNGNRKERRSQFNKKNINIQLHRMLRHCPKRHSYYIIKEKNTCKINNLSYVDDFHQRILFSRLMQIIHDHCVRDHSIRDRIRLNSIDDIINNQDKMDENFHVLLELVGRYFPQWTDIGKNSLINDSIKYKIANFEYNDDIVGYIYDKGTSNKVQIPIIIPSPKSINCDNTSDNYDDNINYSVQVRYISYKGAIKGIAQAIEVEKNNCKWCNCIDLCKESVYSVDLKKS